MSENYDYVCQRAELLGEPIPDKEEWLACRTDTDNQINDEDNVNDLEESGENMQRIGGGLDELNSILSITQKKINRFKTVCGSLGQLLKGKTSLRNTTPTHQHEHVESKNEGDDSDLQTTETIISATTLDTADNDTNVISKTNEDDTTTLSSIKKHDINNKLGSHIDKLDSLITKAENAQYSMKHQTKQMKTIIKK